MKTTFINNFIRRQGLSYPPGSFLEVNAGRGPLGVNARPGHKAFTSPTAVTLETSRRLLMPGGTSGPLVSRNSRGKTLGTFPPPVVFTGGFLLLLLGDM